MSTSPSRSDVEHVVRVRDYTRTPGGRDASDGKFPGREFLRLHLAPAFQRASDANASLLVDLDGTAGYPSSFLDEAFAGLVRQFGKASVRAKVRLKSEDEPYLIADVQQYIDEA